MRDRAIQFAKVDTTKALFEAKKTKDPWNKAQAFSWVMRYAEEKPLEIAKMAKQAAENANDKYQQSAVRAWEIVAVAERGFLVEAEKSLVEAVTLAKKIPESPSRAESLMLLVHAAFSINQRAAKFVHKAMQQVCKVDGHWRCKRSLRDAGKMFTGDYPVRKFYY